MKQPGVWGYILLASLLNVATPQPPPGKPPPVYSKELESELRQELFGSYEVQQRPQKLNTVRSSLNLLSLNYLDIKEQKLSITAYFTFVWFDSRLLWVSNSNYSNIRFLFSNELHVWTPSIIIENSVDDIDVISKPNVPMRINNKGRIMWMPAGIFTTHCESTVTYWPLDTQKCDVILSSWSYTSQEVTLAFDDKIIITTFYRDNGEWELVSKTHSSVTAEREFESFSRLIFTLKFRRRPLFHVLNTLFPVVLMGFLTVTIFKLNPESGEKIGLALTILLAYAVYLGLISESIPQTSLSASLLSTYLASILLLQTLAVFLTVIYLDIYFTPADRPVPRWLQGLASSCHAKLTRPDCSRKTTKITPENTMEECDDTPNMPVKRNLETEDSWVENDSKDADFETDYSWKEIALFLDKVTLYVYLIFVTGLTCSFMSVMVYHYVSSYS